MIMATPLLDPLDTDSRIPIYRQIKDRIRRRIVGGTWTPGDKVPSENQLVRALEVSRMTVHRALRELTQEGVLERVAGVGSFVAEPPRHASLIELRNIADEIAEAGHVHSARLISEGRVLADGALAGRLEIDAGREIFQVSLVHARDGVPIQLEERWVNPEAAPRFLESDFRRRTPSEVLLETIEPEEMEHVVQAALPDSLTANRLAISSTEPCLRLLRRTWNRGRVVTFAVLTYPSSRYDLGARYPVSQASPRPVSHQPVSRQPAGRRPAEAPPQPKRNRR